MARRLRIKVPGHAAAYHVVTRTNGQEFRLDRHMKEFYIGTLQKLSRLYYARYCSWAVMDNHTHLLVCFRDPEDIDEKEAIKRWNDYHEKEYRLNASVQQYREYVVQQLTDVSSFMKRLNVLMTNGYKRHTGKKGTLWQSRFHSTIFERGIPLLAGAAYIELNGFRASLAKKPEEYQFCSLNYLKHGNKAELVNLDLLEEGLEITPVFKDLTDRKAFTAEIYQTYLAYIYEAGTEAKGSREQGITITSEMKAQLSKYGIQGERKDLHTRTWEYSKSILVGNSEYAQRFYEDHINRGYTGEKREDHIAQWLHTSGSKLKSIFSIFHPELLGIQRRRLPSRDGP